MIEHPGGVQTLYTREALACFLTVESASPIRETLFLYLLFSISLSPATRPMIWPERITVSRE